MPEEKKLNALQQQRKDERARLSRERSQAYYAQNKARMLDERKAAYDANHGRKKKKYYEKNRRAIIIKNNAYQKAHPPKRETKNKHIRFLDQFNSSTFRVDELSMSPSGTPAVALASDRDRLALIDSEYDPIPSFNEFY